MFLGQGSNGTACLPLERSPLWGVLHVVEGLALVVLCSCRPATRRLAVNVLKEVRALHNALGMSKVSPITYSALLPLWSLSVAHNYFLSNCQGDEELAIDVMDRVSASVLESFIHLTGADQVEENTNTHFLITEILQRQTCL